MLMHISLARSCTKRFYLGSFASGEGLSREFRMQMRKQNISDKEEQ